MSLKKESSPLLNGSNPQQIQIYSDAANSPQSHSLSSASHKQRKQRTKSSSLRTYGHVDHIHIRTHTKSADSGDSVELRKQSSRECCARCWGRIFQFMERKKLQIVMQRGYEVLLINAILICVLLIISRIYDNTLWHSDVFMSDSAPLLLTANIIMMASYSIENFLALRLCLSTGCFFFALWGLTSSPVLFDTAMFNAVMFLFNIRHAMKLMYARRYIAFGPELEQIYVHIFQGKLTRVDFKKLADISMKRSEKKGTLFKAKGDEITSLCCLVKGRMSVVRQHENAEKALLLHRVGSIHQELKTQLMEMEEMEDSDIAHFLRDPGFVNLCHENQFIEAPQWIAADLKPDGDRFTVSFFCVDDCEYIKWTKEALIGVIDGNPDINHALSGVLGYQTARALLRSREYTKIQAEMSIAQQPGKLAVHTERINEKDVVEVEEKNDDEHRSQQDQEEQS